MRKLIFTVIIIICSIGTSAQYYIRGEVNDEHGEPLSNAKIYMPSTRSIFYSGYVGGFGIPTSKLYDSLIISKSGYITQAIKINSTLYQKVVLKMIAVNTSVETQKLISLTSGKDGNMLPLSYFNGESYTNIIENDFIKTDLQTKTSFSMRTDKASYSNVRRIINQGMKVPTDAVRIDEMLNYFNFNYREPPRGDVFKLTSQLTSCPWNKEHQLLFIDLSARKLNLEKIPPSNLVFLIDVSGSMDQPNRLPLLKAAFHLLVKNLRPIDTVSIVVYGGTVGIWLKPTCGSEKEKISKSIEELNASGDTPGEAAIRTAYKLAETTYIKGGNNRIILATDGDFNVGQASEKELENLISKEKLSGVFLTCLGVGMGNYKDSKIEVLAKKGNGNFAYIDDLREAEKILITEFTQTMYSVASDVFLSVRFNPNLVAQYRLLGYDNKKSVLDVKSTVLEGGEIGSGADNTIVFELVPAVKELNDSLAGISINYRTLADSTFQSIYYNCSNNYVPLQQLAKSWQFATAVTMFGLKLRGSVYFPPVDWDVIKKLAQDACSPNNYLQSEFISLLDKCKVIYYEKKKKRKHKTNTHSNS
ncbi:MAG: von Willebrand factor type A domain-containing protein [Ginsengibacter sp.]